MSRYLLDEERYKALARKTVAEGCVLLKNEDQALPLRKNEKIAVFGRCAFNYYKGGLGSGGLVNTKYTVSILDALKQCEDITLNEELLSIYEEWILSHPYEEGEGWGTVPWSQEEMPVTDHMLEVSNNSDAAVVIIGRTAGEDQDNSNEEGSYLLTSTEIDMIRKVSQTFKRTIVLLNVGNIIDMSWVSECNPSAVMYVWQGGQEGGNGVLDVLVGNVNPSGRLTDTIAANINDYPSTKNFGNEIKNYYEEDIYVGYRYFESCKKEHVLYPFGYGLSYTSFNIESELTEVKNDRIVVNALITNTGDIAGKEVVEVYVKAPQGRLGKPLRVLAGFAKTDVIAPGEKEECRIEIMKEAFASYDDSGITGHKSCFLLEEGEYELYVGKDVRDAKLCGSFQQEEFIVEALEEACAPVEEFERFHLENKGTGYAMAAEKVPTRTVKTSEVIEKLREKEIPYTGDCGYSLGDVLDGKVSMEQFISQLSDYDLMCLFYGEGMCSLKVTPGTAGAFGGITERLNKFGIPAACCADGPSGIRMDCGTKAFLLPIGTALGCTFNEELVMELYQMLSLELRKNRIDSLLGPGINIHRSPLNGRNFEYISEDPFLTGKIATAQVKGLAYAGVTGTIKHFCGNNQEHHRCEVEAVVSERALREIYLKCFEIAIKEGNARSVMTTYGPVNGLWTAGSYDLCTLVLRKQWGFDGIVMTDWWAVANEEGRTPEKRNRASMLLAQNDLYMCCADVEAELNVDNIKEAFESGVITRADLQRNARNILDFVMNSPAMLHELGRIEREEVEQMKRSKEEEEGMEDIEFYFHDPKSDAVEIAGNEIDTTHGKSKVYGIKIKEDGEYHIAVDMKSHLTELAQLPLSIYVDNIYRMTLSFNGTNGENVVIKKKLCNMAGENHYVKLVFGASGIILNKIQIYNAS